MATEPGPFSTMQALPLPLPQRDELDRLKGQFLASLNHEIRTPLSGLLGMTELLLETELTEEQMEYVRSTRECANSLLEVLNSVLAYSALQGGLYRFESTEFSPRELIESLGQEAAARAAAKGVEWQLLIDGSVPQTVSGSPRHLRECLWQIVQNALKFTNTGSVQVAVSCDPPEPARLERTMRIQVRDTGIGIHSEDLIQIFDSFTQLENGLARSYSGLGLGLAIADKLVRKMGGLIQAESQLGKGSVFTLVLPVQMPSPEMAVRPQLVRRGPGAARRVLLVDDNKIAQQIIRHVMRREQYELVTADGGEEAVALARDNEFDLILMDLQMPRQDGFATADEIRRIPHHARTPILAVSANQADEHRAQCALHGIQGFIAKPIDRQTLLSAVEQALTGGGRSQAAGSH
ncbi:MAG: response regulator [Bryobacterales bacterium]|nr:response regulator [Bryobacterales bacterium]